MPPTPDLPPEKRACLVRLMLRALHDLDLPASAHTLAEEAGVSLFPEPLRAFRAAVEAGDWPAAAAAAPELPLRRPRDDEPAVRAELARQRYRELLAARELQEALCCLREELRPLLPADELHRLAARLLGDEEQHDLVAGRRAVLESVEQLLEPAQAVRRGRLETLLGQARTLQAQQCPAHNVGDGDLGHSWLFEDHRCPPEAVPRRAVAVLDAHRDEVWCLAFSASGARLATAGRDLSVIVWDTSEPAAASVLTRIGGHAVAPHCVAWNPGETQLLTCAHETTVRRWAAGSGELLAEYEAHTEPVSAAKWAGSDDLFVTGGLDARVILWRVSDGARLWVHAGERVNDLAVSLDGRRVVACSERLITVISVPDGAEERVIEDQELISSVCLADDGEHVLVNTAGSVVRLLSVSGTSSSDVSFSGHRQTRYVLRSCFGGANQAFVASGSEDAQVYVWARGSQRLVATLRGHSGTVNAVAWHPTNPRVMASVSDDRTVRLWG